MAAPLGAIFQGVGSSLEGTAALIPLLYSIFAKEESPYNQLGSASDFQNINPLTAAFMEQLSGRQQNLDNMLSSYLGKADQGRDRAQGYLDTLGSQRPNANYDPQAGFNSFLSQFPALQNVINNSGIGEFGGDNENLKALQANLTRQAMNALPQGASRSGAGSNAFASAFASPLFELASQGQNQRSAALSNGIQQLLGLGTQNEQNRFAAESTNYNQLIDTLSRAFQGELGIAESNMGGASLSQQALSQILGIQAQYAAPEWWSPTYVANPNYMSMLDRIGMSSEGLAQLGASFKNFSGGGGQAGSGGMDFMQMIQSFGGK